MSEPQKGRIAIKLGGGGGSKPSPTTKPIQFKAKLPAPSSTLGKRPRSNHNAWGGDDSDEDETHGKSVSITGFGAEGAENDKVKKEAKKEYVIARQPNRDWKAEAKSQQSAEQGGKDLLPPEARAQRNGEEVKTETEPADQDKEIKWGLTIMDKKPSTNDADKAEQTKDEPMEDEKKAGVKDETGHATSEPTADDEAMDALLGRAPAKLQKTIVSNEIDAFHRDMDTAGDASTLADYDAMPVEEFGAALLRGMGWNGEDRGPKRKEVKRRPAQLGLGAKELNAAEDLGGWNQGNGGKKKRPRLDEYRREEERRKESRRRDDSDSHDRDRPRESDRDRHRDRERHRDHRDRDRDYDRDRHRHRDHHRDYRR